VLNQKKRILIKYQCRPTLALLALFNFLTYLPLFFSEELYTEINITVLVVEIALIWLLFTALRQELRKLDRSSGCAIEVASAPPALPK
jgi:hypothetical protein